MDKVIKIDGKEVGFRATALTPRLYRHKMQRDIVQDFSELERSFKKALKAKGLTEPGKNATAEEKAAYEEQLREAQLSATDLEIFENVTFVMARQYDSTIPDSVEEWLEDFNFFSIYEVLPEILTLWHLNNATTANAKKSKAHSAPLHGRTVYAALC